MPDEVLTAEELAVYLKVDVQTVYRKFRAGEIPGVRIGRAVRFKREVVDSWLRASSWNSGNRDRAALWERMERFAARKGIRERDVVPAVRQVRRGRG
jgi:excisionase family DNA binding protein